MKKTFIFLLSIIILFGACSNTPTGNNPSIIGTWKEHRADPTDDYGLGEYSFNSDGSGVFKVYGITNIQKFSFLWERHDATTIRIITDTEEDYLEINNGLLIEKSNLFGTIVYKKK